MPAQVGSDGGGSGSVGGSASVDIDTFYRRFARVHVAVAALGAFKVVESFTTDDGLTWVKERETASAAFANGTANRLNTVVLTDVILHRGHKFTFVDTSAVTNNFDYSIGVINGEPGI